MLILKNFCIATKTIKVLRLLKAAQIIVVLFAFVCIVKNAICCFSE